MVDISIRNRDMLKMKTTDLNGGFGTLGPASGGRLLKCTQAQQQQQYFLKKYR